MRIWLSLFKVCFVYFHFLIILITFNCQGVASKPFLQVLRDMIKQHQHDILALLEPSVSGVNADDICLKIGYANWG